MKASYNTIGESLLSLGAPKGDALDDLICEVMTITRAFNAQNIEIVQHDGIIDICFDLKRALNGSEQLMVEQTTETLQKHNVGTSIGEQHVDGVFKGHFRWSFLKPPQAAKARTEPKPLDNRSWYARNREQINFTAGMAMIGIGIGVCIYGLSTALSKD